MKNPFSKNKHHHGVDHINGQYRIVTIEKPNSSVADCYRRIKVGLEYSNVDKDVKIIQTASSVTAEGKTITALNLAACYAEDKKKVIVVDLDFRKPKVHRAFKIQNKDGITDFLAGNISREAVIRHSEWGIDFVNRGHDVPNPSAIISSEALEHFVRSLADEYDMVIVDCPPVLAVADAVSIARFTDGCLFIVNAKKSEKSMARESIRILNTNKVPVLGIVFTDTPKVKKDYYKYYSHYYMDSSSENK